MDEIKEVYKRKNETPVLTYLKQCVQKLENEVVVLKQSFNAINFDFLEDDSRAAIYFQKAHSIKKEIDHLQHESQKLKSLLNPKVERTKCYYLDMEDLTLDIEDEVAILEKHLKNYGYKPLELDTSSEEESISVIDSSYYESEISEHDLSQTPQMDIPSGLFQKRNCKPEQEETVEEDLATPELHLEPEKKPRHRLSSPLPSFSLGSASRLGDVARRLDF